jgi:hypothetical protein
MQWEGQGFATIGFGIQGNSRDFTTRAEPIIYDEPALITSAQNVGSGLLFEISGGYRVWRNLVVGLGYSHFGDSSASTVSASIPSPLVPDAPRNASASVGDLGHSENGFHFTATWMIPVTDKIEVGVFGGPSVYRVGQDLVSDIPFIESEDPFPTVTLGTPVVTEENVTAVGVNIGAEVSYLVTARYGVTGFLRYAGATAEFDGVDGRDLKVGGVHLGVGFRYRF